MPTPELTEAEWRYVQRIMGSIASTYDDDLAESIRTKIYHALGGP